MALPDELLEVTIRKYRLLCESSGCHGDRELAAFLARERKPQACPLASLLRGCCQLEIEVKLPVCLSLGVAGRDTHWVTLLAHLQTTAEAPEASLQFRGDVKFLSQAWAAI